MTPDVERLRALERAYRETRAPEDEARWLVERVRVGLTSAAALRTASDLGYLPAVLARGDEWRPLADLNAFAAAIARFDSEELSTRAIFALALLVLPVAGGDENLGDDLAQARQLVAAASNGLPDRERCAALDVRISEAVTAYWSNMVTRHMEPSDMVVTEISDVARFALRAASYERDAVIARVDGEPTAPRDLFENVLRSGVLAPTSPRRSFLANEERLRAAILEAIIPWLLGLERDAP
jgi:hypothetical protein